MKKLSLIALAAVLGASGFAAAPALAATTPAGGVPMCSGNSSPVDFQRASQELLAQKGFVNRTVNSVDQWNNCIKVIYSDASGHTTTAFYDPDSLKLIDRMSSGSSLG